MPGANGRFGAADEFGITPPVVATRGWRPGGMRLAARIGPLH